MPRIAAWRGCPEFTLPEDGEEIFQLAHLSKDDVFYDLGCGHGWVCIWASPHCKSAVGIEELKLLARRALKNVVEARVKNVRIILGNFLTESLDDATILYCVSSLKVQHFEAWSRGCSAFCMSVKHRANRRALPLRIVTVGPPPIPIMPTATLNSFCLTTFPYRLAKTLDEWYSAVLNPGSPRTWRSVRERYQFITREGLRGKKDELEHYFLSKA